ncbi:CRISPR-associated endonuclease Cas9 [Trichinella pseudospiralis]
MSERHFNLLCAASIRPQSTPLVLKHHLASTRWITMHAVRLLTRAQMNDKALERRRVYVKLTSTMGEHVDYCSQRMDNHWYAD